MGGGGVTSGPSRKGVSHGGKEFARCRGVATAGHLLTGKDSLQSKFMTGKLLWGGTAASREEMPSSNWAVVSFLLPGKGGWEGEIFADLLQWKEL